MLLRIEYWNDGHAKKETAEIFKVSHFTFAAERNRQFRGKTTQKSWYKIDPAKPEEYGRSIQMRI